MKHGPTLGGMGGLEAGPCRPAIGGDADPRSQAAVDARVPIPAWARATLHELHHIQM